MAATLIGLLLIAVIRAYVIAQLWRWFIAPAFNLPEINLSTAFGISLFAGLFSSQVHTPDKEDSEPIAKVFVMTLAHVASLVLVLLVGGIVHSAASD